MTERTGGSRTLKDGQIIDIVEPPQTHPEGHRARTAEGHVRDSKGRVVLPEAPAPQRATEARRQRPDRVVAAAE